jgi:hypothetical protein
MAVAVPCVGLLHLQLYKLCYSATGKYSETIRKPDEVFVLLSASYGTWGGVVVKALPY